jgi:hypothetical protein
MYRFAHFVLLLLLLLLTAAAVAIAICSKVMRGLVPKMHVCFVEMTGSLSV